MSVSITYHLADSKVARDFHAGGSYASPGFVTAESTAAAAGGVTGAVGAANTASAYELICSLYQSDGATLIQNRATGNLGNPSGNWDVHFTVAANYSDCMITAVLQVDGNDSGNDSISGINVKSGSGGSIDEA